jgi:hypothetical protein
MNSSLFVEENKTQMHPIDKGKREGGDNAQQPTPNAQRPSFEEKKPWQYSHLLSSCLKSQLICGSHRAGEVQDEKKRARTLVAIYMLLAAFRRLASLARADL